MNRTEFNLMFWGSFIAYAIARNAVVSEWATLALSWTTLIFWMYCTQARAQSIGWTQAWAFVMLLPFVNLLFALVIGVYQPRNNVSEVV